MCVFSFIYIYCIESKSLLLQRVELICTSYASLPQTLAELAINIWDKGFVVQTLQRKSSDHHSISGWPTKNDMPAWWADRTFKSSGETSAHLSKHFTWFFTAATRLQLTIEQLPLFWYNPPLHSWGPQKDQPPNRRIPRFESHNTRVYKTLLTRSKGPTKEPPSHTDQNNKSSPTRSTALQE